jgi:cell division septum initiation protein DivIVA
MKPSEAAERANGQALGPDTASETPALAPEPELWKVSHVIYGLDRIAKAMDEAIGEVQSQAVKLANPIPFLNLMARSQKDAQDALAYLKEYQGVQHDLQDARRDTQWERKRHEDLKEAVRRAELAKRERAGKLVEGAKAEAEGIVKAAEEEAKRVVREAEAKGQRVVADQATMRAELATARTELRDFIARARETEARYDAHIARKLKAINRIEAECVRMEAVAQLMASKVAEMEVPTR